ncbi:MAG: zinc-binding dehydrogenase [Saprospiraceae bacterium]|nr:zinc-binding dehydrogenase [Saprospiraceae bacterium]
MQAYVFQNINELPFKTEINIPEIQDNEEIVEIKASALNHRDLWITKGQYPNLRFGTVLGSDGCVTLGGNTFIINPGLNWGTTEKYQSDRFKILGMPDFGTFAEYLHIDRTYLYTKPTHLSNEEAAALPLAGVTAYRALVVKTQPEKGEKVLISGVGGGVALFAMQFALALGCEVYVTSGSEHKIEKAKELGAKAGYLYQNPDWTKQLISDIGGVDVVIDGACGPTFNNLVKICNPGARISFYGGTQGKIDGLNPQLIFWRQISVFGSTMGSDLDFVNMLSLVEKYRIKPVIDCVLPFDHVHDGFRKMKEGTQFGKIVFSH